MEDSRDDRPGRSGKEAEPPFDPNFNPARAAAGDPYPFDTAVTGQVEVTDEPIDFTPVPRPGSGALKTRKWRFIA